MRVKKWFFTWSFLFLNLASFAAETRYIIFFAETTDIPKAVVNKIVLSDRFCMVVPQDFKNALPENLNELISAGKIELAVSLDPEPILTILAEINENVFKSYIKDGLSRFENSVNDEKFGLFLNSAKMSHLLLQHLSELKLAWVNADNISGDAPGAYFMHGIAVFSLYKNFPYKQLEVMKWLESKSGCVIPVFLTKKHLQDIGFMEYIIELFDSSKYIKPAVPLYILEDKNELLVRKDVSFEDIYLDRGVFEKLLSAAKDISNYAALPSFSEVVYNNAENELIYMCSFDNLKNMYSGCVAAKRVFNAAYDNIYRLLKFRDKNVQDVNSTNRQTAPPNSKLNTADGLGNQTEIKIVPDGVSIYNNGLLKLVQITSEGNKIKINLHFNGSGVWSDKVAFVDFYVDLNGIPGIGGTSLIYGIDGFLTADSGWEYAVRIYSDRAVLYKYSGNGATVISNLDMSGSSIYIPVKYIRGNPLRWGFQAVVVSEVNGKKSVTDFFNPGPKTKTEILSVEPLELPLIRLIYDYN
ncbi:MAG: hypothetical protein LBL71_01820 [Endomicrobium sp.]|jgi:hypothetical protein|nr:hypothetical protein [Endomicrobium sp.]